MFLVFEGEFPLLQEWHKWVAILLQREVAHAIMGEKTLCGLGI
jgi:hypothetical protein